MQLERKKELVIVNGKKKKSTKKAARRRTAARRPAPSAPRRRRSSRRRNPGTDWGGTAVAAGVGIAGLLGLQLVTQQARRIKHRPVRAAVRTLVPALVGLGGGAFAGRKWPAVGKSLAAVGMGLSALHGLSELANGGATPSVLLQRAGFAQLGAAEDVIERDGQLLRVLPDGRTQLLFGLGEETAPVVIRLADGTQEAGTFLGDLGEGEVLVMDGRGNLLALPSGGGDMAGIEDAEHLGAIEEAEQLNGADDDEGLGATGDDMGFSE
jgi:hypothetical protein